MRLTKVLAGWLWLMGGVALYVFWLLVLALVSGGRVLPPETLHVLPIPGRRGGPGRSGGAAHRPLGARPADLGRPVRRGDGHVPARQRLHAGIRHPLRWVIGAVLVFAFVVHRQ